MTVSAIRSVHSQGRRSLRWSLLAISMLLSSAGAPSPAAAQSVLDRVRERAASRAEQQTEQRTNERVDETVDKTVDCVFNPLACAKQAQTPPAGETPPAPGGAAGAAPSADGAQWYSEKQGQRIGPMPRAELATMATRGELNATTLVWREGLEDWKQAGQVPELADVLRSVPPPLPPQRSGPPPLPSR